MNKPLIDAFRRIAQESAQARWAKGTALVLAKALVAGVLTPERIQAALPPDAPGIDEKDFVQYLAGLDEQAVRTLDGLMLRAVNRIRRK